MKKKTIFVIIISILTYSLIVFYGDFSEILKSLTEFNLLFIPIIIFLTTINYLIRFFRWDYYLKKAGIRIPLKQNFYIFIAGMSMGITPVKSGELIKSYILKENYNLPYRKTFPVVVLDRVSDATGLLLLALIGLSVFERGIAMLVLISFFLLIIFLILRNRRISIFLLARMCRIRFMEKYIKEIKETYSVFRQLSGLRITVTTALISAFSWFFECLALYFTVLAFKSSITLLESMFVFSFSTLAGALSMLPGGLGVAEGSMVGLLVYLGIPGSTAGMATIIIRLLTLWFGLFLGFAALAKVRKTGKQNKQKKQ